MALFGLHHVRRRTGGLIAVAALFLPLAAAFAGPAAAQADPGFRITTTSLPAATVGQSYSAQIDVTGGTPPYVVWLSDVADYPLPPGLSMSLSGLISGTPGSPPGNQPATYTVLVQAEDAGGPQYANTALSIALTPPGYVAPPPLVITTDAIPAATYDQPFSFQLSAGGGTAPYTWTATNLPPGFTISDSGVISGQNTLPEQATITVQATDSGAVYSNSYGVHSSAQQTVARQYTFTVTSGYPQLDPTLFALSGLLVQSNGLAFTVLGLIESLPNSAASQVGVVQRQLNGLLCQLTAVNQGKSCLLPGLPLLPPL